MSDRTTSPIHYVRSAASEKVDGDAVPHSKDESTSTAERVAAEAWYILSQGGGVFWNIADLQEGEMLLPSYVEKKQDGYYLDLTVLERSPRAFYEFVDRTFNSWAYLFKLDYPSFSKIVHHPEQALEIKKELEEKGVPPQLRFAIDIIRISEERRPLYRSVQVAASLADACYFFEPVYVDRTVTKIGADGQPYETVEQVKAKLDFDEFVAHLWKNGVRYGLLEKEIRQAIDAEPQKSWRVTVAAQLEAKPWIDATTVEATKKMKQDKTPKIHSDGRVDLSQFANFFPQVNAEDKLLEKIPRVMGTAWMNIGGLPIEPEIPKDFDLSKTAWPWTRIVKENGKEYVVASMNGFVNVDPKTNTISVSEKVVHHWWIHAKVTGKRLELEGALEEKEDVAEDTVTESPSSIWAKKNVYGTLMSHSWVVEVDGNVVGGKILTEGEAVTVKWAKFSNSRIDARNAEVTVVNAENSIIFCKKAVIERAKNCVIVAEEAEITTCESSSVWCKSAKIQFVTWSKTWLSSGTPTVISLELPDFEELNKPLEEVTKSLEEIEKKRAAAYLARQENVKAYAEIASEADVKAFLETDKKIKAYKAGGGKLTPEQEKNFLKMRNPILPKLVALQECLKKNAEYKALIETLDIEIAPLVMLKQDLEREISRAGEGISIKIEMATAKTVVRTRPARKPAQPNEEEKKKLPAQPKSWRKHAFVENVAKWLSDIANPVKLNQEASEIGPQAERLFDAESGAFEWKYAPKTPSAE